MSPEFQGYFYLFIQLSLLAQMGDMGLHAILYFMIARLYGKLKNKSVLYQNQALTKNYKVLNVIKFLYNYSIIVPIFLFPLLYFFGMYFFFKSDEQNNEIQFAWLLLCFAVSIEISTIFLNAQVESFDKITLSNKIKFTRVFFRSIILWLFLYFGFGLKSIAYSTIASVAIFFILYFYNFKNLIVISYKSKTKNPVKWSKDIWPLQWKIGLSMFFGAHILYISPLLMTSYFLGVIETGKLGISLAIIEAVIAVSNLFLNVVQPKITYLIVEKKYIEVKKILLRRTFYSILTTVFGGACFYILMLVVESYYPKFYVRFMPLEYIYILIIAGILRHFVGVLNIFVRAHKSEYLMLSFVLAGLGCILLNIILIPKYGLLGVCLSYLLVKLIFHLPFCVYLFRNFLIKNKISFK